MVAFQSGEATGRKLRLPLRCVPTTYAPQNVIDSAAGECLPEEAQHHNLPMKCKTNPFYLEVRRRRSLEAAWKVIFANGRMSQSVGTRRQVQEFTENAYRNLEHIAEHLRAETFEFMPAHGVPIKRPKKSDRPIVIAPIHNRVVQRSILDVLQRHPSIQEFILIPTSYGGLRPRKKTNVCKTLCLKFMRNLKKIRFGT